MNLVVAPGVLEALITHAKSRTPVESCGLIVGRRGIGERFVPVRNILESSTAYEMEPAELIRTLRELRESGEELQAICHSHPSGPEHPSADDVRRAYYPEAAHVIVSFADPEKPVVRAFRIIDGSALEIDLHAIV